MKRPLLLTFVLSLAASALAHADEEKPFHRDAAAAETLGWHLATKAYTFRAYTLFETIDISKELGVKYFEVNPTQKMSKNAPVNTDQTLTPALRALLKKKFTDAGVQPVNFGVVKLTGDEAADRKIFEFAKDMGIQTIVSEPDPAAFPILDKLCEDFQINVAIHNHPQPSPYWKPEIVLKAIDGHSKRIGACADVGHWTRSGLDTVECLHQMQGHIITLHFKDVDEQKQDVPWGTGNSNVKGMLDELHRQHFQGFFSMEYESGNGRPSIDDLKKSIVTFDAEAKRILETK